MQTSLLKWRLNLLLMCFVCLSPFAAICQLSFTVAAPSTSTAYASPSGATQLIAANTDDYISNAAVNIGFNFKFGCYTYSQFRVSTNGFISLGNSSLQNMATNNLNTLRQGPIIAPLWDDLHMSGSVVMKLSGSSPNQVLTVEWRDAKWNKNASNPVMSFMVKLYEADGTIEFHYTRESTNVNSGSASIGVSGGFVSGDFYSINLTNNNAYTANYGSETNSINIRPADNLLIRWTPNNMSVTSATTIQPNLTDLSKCNNYSQEIVGLKIVSRGCQNAKTVSEIRLNMTGSTAPLTDVAALHIYYSGTGAGFAAAGEFGSATILPSTSTITVTGSQALLAGDNYFWIAYDVNPGAVVNNLLDAQCTRVTIDGTNTTPTVQSPTGTRKIINCTAAPGGITGASFWIKADAGLGLATGAKVPTWEDQSGNNRDATQTSNNNRPTFYDNSSSNVNFNPIVFFDAASQAVANGDYMDITANGILSTDNNPYVAYAVIVPTDDNLVKPGKFLFSGEFGLSTFNAFDVRSNHALNDSWSVNDKIINDLWTEDNPIITSFRYDFAGRQVFVDGESKGTRVGPIRTSPDANAALGVQRSVNPLIEFFNGGMAEIITFANNAHDQNTQKKIQTYLGIKYGATLAHNYRASNNTIVWDRYANASYNNNVIGIARDDMSNLSQKQSKSTSVSKDILTIYIGNKQTNQANNAATFTAGDKSFFMVGTNKLSALDTWPSTNEKPAGICCRILREWLVQQTNFTNTNLKLEFDFNSVTTGYLPLNAADLRLLVDADGDFSNATILTTPTISINAAAGVATITVPSSAFTGKPYFTLASASTSTLLPIELKRFTGQCKENETVLNWATDHTGKAGFTIERSSDKTNFSAVGVVKTNETGNYTWTDASPLPGVVYYRLKSVAENGSPIYSPVVAVNGCNSNHISFSSNPSTGQSTLTLQLLQNEEADINMYDVMGRKINMPELTGKRSLSRGVYRVPVNIPGATAGMYFLYVELNGEKQVFKVLKAQ